MPARPIHIVEVAPRDGLQNEAVSLAPESRAELIAQARQAGLRRIEAASFVNPKRVPQMAGAAEVIAAARARNAHAPGVSLSALALNLKGAERAIAAAVDEINFVVVASETFNRRNQGCDIARTLAQWREVRGLLRAAGIPGTLTIGAAFGCPFEGEIAPDAPARLVAQLGDDLPDEIALADTIGVAAPSDVAQRFALVEAAAPGVALRAHLHNTRNTGLANAAAALSCGVTALDASLGGFGGCPFAPAATGNIPTEDLSYMLQRMGHLPGIDLDAAVAAAAWLGEQLGHAPPGLLGRAGVFPPPVPRDR